MVPIRTLFLASLLLEFTSSVGAADPPPITQPELAEIVRATLKESPQSISKPVFRVEGRELAYMPGRFRQTKLFFADDEPPPDWQPIDCPFRLQFTSQIYKDHFRTTKYADLWTKALEPMDAIVVDELKLLRMHSHDRKQLYTKLLEQNKKGDDLVHKAAEAYARQRNLRLTPVFGTPGEYQITFVTEPRGATVRYLPKFKYVLYEKQNALKSDETWVPIVEQDEDKRPMAMLAYGNYYFLASWGGNQKKTLGVVSITKEQQVVIRRN